MLTVTIAIKGIPRYDFRAINRTEKWERGKYKVGVQYYEVEIKNHERPEEGWACFEVQHPYGDLPGLVQKLVALVKD